MEIKIIVIINFSVRNEKINDTSDPCVPFEYGPGDTLQWQLMLSHF